MRGGGDSGCVWGGECRRGVKIYIQKRGRRQNTRHGDAQALRSAFPTPNGSMVAVDAEAATPPPPVGADNTFHCVFRRPVKIFTVYLASRVANLQRNKGSTDELTAKFVLLGNKGTKD